MPIFTSTGHGAEKQPPPPPGRHVTYISYFPATKAQRRQGLLTADCIWRIPGAIRERISLTLMSL